MPRRDKPYVRDRATVMLEEIDNRRLRDDLEEHQKSLEDYQRGQDELNHKLLMRLREIETHDHREDERRLLAEREEDRLKLAKLEERISLLFSAVSAPRKISPGELVAYLALVLTVLGTIGNAVISLLKGG